MPRRCQYERAGKDSKATVSCELAPLFSASPRPGALSLRISTLPPRNANEPSLLRSLLKFVSEARLPCVSLVSILCLSCVYCVSILCLSRLFCVSCLLCVYCVSILCLLCVYLERLPCSRVYFVSIVRLSCVYLVSTVCLSCVYLVSIACLSSIIQYRPNQRPSKATWRGWPCRRVSHSSGLAK